MQSNLDSDYSLPKPPQARYLSVTETAKLIRIALAKAFPGQKFSVRSSSYSGGASIDISYSGGPTIDDVEATTNPFEGAGFDGSIDLKYYREAWLSPEGTVSLAHDPGTTGSKGMAPEEFGDAPAPGSELVHFGANFIHVRRDVSEAEYWPLVEQFEQETGVLVRHDVWRGQATHYWPIECMASRGWKPYEVLDHAGRTNRDVKQFAGDPPPMEEAERIARALHSQESE